MVYSHWPIYNGNRLMDYTNNAWATPIHPCKCHEQTVLEIKNPTPITNIIVQHFDLCDHHVNSRTGLICDPTTKPFPQTCINIGLGDSKGFYNNAPDFANPCCNQQPQSYVDLYSHQGLSLPPIEMNKPLTISASHNSNSAFPSTNFPFHPRDPFFDRRISVPTESPSKRPNKLNISTINNESNLVGSNADLIYSERLTNNFSESQLGLCGNKFSVGLGPYSKDCTNKTFKKEDRSDLKLKDHSTDRKSTRVDSPSYTRRKSRSLSRNRHRIINRSSKSPRNRRHYSLTLKNRRLSPKSVKPRDIRHASIRTSRSSNTLSKNRPSPKGQSRDSGNILESSSENNGKSSLMDKISSHDFQGELEREKLVWTRTSPADLYYRHHSQNSDANVVCGTDRLAQLCDEFEDKLLKKSELIRAELPKYEPLSRKKRISIKKHSGCHSCNSSNSSGSDDESDQEDCTKEELEHKKKHPLRLHQELWFNDPGEMNDGPLCRCSARARRSGIRHNIYAGENHLPRCNPQSNNADRLYHYRITISPPTNFLVKTPTIIEYDEHEYIFEGFSMFSHKKLDELPLCKVIRFNIEYTIVYFEEKFPENFTIRELDAFYTYLFQEILELVDLDLRADEDSEGCPRYHFMPRFVRELPGNGKEILSMNEVLKYLIQSSSPLVSPDGLTGVLSQPQYDWQHFTESLKGMIVTYPGKKPCSLRVDQLDRDQDEELKPRFPEIVHFGIRPPQLSYAGNPEYQKAWREYVKFRHLLANMPKPSFEDKRKLEAKEIRLQNMRTKSELKRNVTVTVSSEHFNKTGIMCDVVQHAMLVPVLVSHLRFHQSLDELEDKIKYRFNNRYLLQLALTHPSYRENFGTNPDHARNSLTNCGIRQPVYGDRRIHYMNTRKRGINTLINIMSRFGKTEETESNITHNERLEFLGDAVVEFVTSVHLFHMFPELEEGGLATYRAAIVQNQHLAVLAKTLGLEEYMLYAHGSDLCHDLELRHAMANCFEALMGALFLDGGILVADKVFGEALFRIEPDLLKEWVCYPPHPLQEQEPLGDRKWIAKFPLLQNLTKFEASIGVVFNHIRLLARAFTDRSIGYTNLTLGSNQRLEFLGDTVLQLIASEYLYKYFPEHHEGHLSLLRSSLVNNRTQAVVCNDLGMTQYALYSNPKAELKTKDRADLLEAFLGSLYVDQGLESCQVFCSVCFFPRLQDFIMYQDWNDPKSKLQQCCLTLRTMEGGEPEIPVYKVIECMGPTNTRIYTVAVYFKGRRLAKASGHSIQQAEMNAAKKALNSSEGLFPQLDHQKRVISKSMNRQHRDGTSSRKITPPKNQKKGKKNGKKENEEKKHLEKHSNAKNCDRGCAIRQRTPPLAYRSKNRSESPCKKDNQENNSEKNIERNETDGILELKNETSPEPKIKIEEVDHKHLSENNAVHSGNTGNPNVAQEELQQQNANNSQERNARLLCGTRDTEYMVSRSSSLMRNAHDDPPTNLSKVNATLNYSKEPDSTSSRSNYSIKSMPCKSSHETSSIQARSGGSRKRSRSRSIPRSERRDKSPIYKFIKDSSPNYRCSRSKQYLSQSSRSSISRSTARSSQSRRSRSRIRSRSRSTSYMRRRSRSREEAKERRRSRSRSRSRSTSNMRRRSRSREEAKERRRSRSRSSSRSTSNIRRRSRSREEAKERLMDFMLGKRKSPGLENQCKASTSTLLVDFVYSKQCSAVPLQINGKYEVPPPTSNVHLNNCAPKAHPQQNIHNTTQNMLYHPQHIKRPEIQLGYVNPPAACYQNQYPNPAKVGPPPPRLIYRSPPPLPAPVPQHHQLGFNQNASHFQNHSEAVRTSQYWNHNSGCPNGNNYNNQDFSYR